LIASVALVDGCALVTHDDRLTARARERGIEVLTTSALLAEFGFIPVIPVSAPRGMP
jgi:rRNA-processing protein FCF1